MHLNILYHLKRKSLRCIGMQIKTSFFINDPYLKQNIHLLGVFNYLQKYKYVLDKEYPLLPAENEDSKNIWVCWLQGIDRAPELVRMCVESIYKYKKDYAVHLISKDNYEQYITIPEHIIKRWGEGIIPNAHFSDIIRLALLSKYGGVWIDATALLTAPLPGYINKSSLFCFKTKNLKAVQASNWFIAAKPHNEIIERTLDLLYEYWQHEKGVIGYSFFHPLFTMATQANKSCIQQWTDVPYFDDVNPKLLQNELFNRYDKERWNQILSLSFIHKLTYKFDNNEFAKEGTFYKAVLQEYLNKVSI